MYIGVSLGDHRELVDFLVTAFIYIRYPVEEFQSGSFVTKTAQQVVLKY